MKRFHYAFPTNRGAFLNFTPYKPYRVIASEDESFAVIDNDGDKLNCLPKKCLQLKGGNWIIPEMWIPRRFLIALLIFACIGLLRYGLVVPPIRYIVVSLIFSLICTKR